VDPGGALRVGPRSAGADPGPACYGLGGAEPTVSDAHCALGHLDPGRELGGGLRLDMGRAVEALGRLPQGSGGAHGVLTVVRATMARALRRVSTEQGVDPSGLALVAYGGAGPLHATALAREVGCRAVVVPPAPGVLSALGLLLAPPRFEASRTVMAGVDEDLSGAWSGLEGDVRRELDRQGATGSVTVVRFVDARYARQSHELRIRLGGDGAGDGGGNGARDEDVAELLHRAHRQAYGYAMEDQPVRIVTLRVDQGEAGPERAREIGVDGETVTARVVSRAGLGPGDRVEGPALVEQPDTTTLLHPGEVAEVDRARNLVVHVGS